MKICTGQKFSKQETVVAGRVSRCDASPPIRILSKMSRLPPGARELGQRGPLQAVTRRTHGRHNGWGKRAAEENRQSRRGAEEGYRLPDNPDRSRSNTVSVHNQFLSVLQTQRFTAARQGASDVAGVSVKAVIYHRTGLGDRRAWHMVHTAPKLR